MRKGQKHTEESKRKMSVNSDNSGSKNPMYGKKQSFESNLKNSIANSGPNHPGWNGGSGYLGYDSNFHEKEYKQDLFESSGYKCQNPEHPSTYKETRLGRHHIDFDKTNSSPLNLIVLCLGCHTYMAHGENKEYYKNLFKGVIK